MEGTATRSQSERIKSAEMSARGQYARAVIRGEQMLSGADLRGKAREWGGVYRRQRQLAVDLARQNGAHIRRCKNGYLRLEWGDVPEHSRESECALGTCYVY